MAAQQVQAGLWEGEEGVPTAPWDIEGWGRGGSAIRKSGNGAQHFSDSDRSQG